MKKKPRKRQYGRPPDDLRAECRARLEAQLGRSISPDWAALAGAGLPTRGNDASTEYRRLVDAFKAAKVFLSKHSEKMDGDHAWALRAHLPAIEDHIVLMQYRLERMRADTRDEGWRGGWAVWLTMARERFGELNPTQLAMLRIVSGWWPFGDRKFGSHGAAIAAVAKQVRDAVRE